MQIDPCPFRSIAFEKLDIQHMAGASPSAAVFKQADAGGMRMRIVSYAPGYVADHWCDIGHFGYVLWGCVAIDLKEKPTVHLSEGEAFIVSSYGDASHRLRAETGARLLLLD